MMSHRRLGDVTNEIVERNRRERDLRAAYDGRIPPDLWPARPKSPPVDAEAKLLSSIAYYDGEAEDWSAKATRWATEGREPEARACRQNASDMAEQARIRRDALDKLRADRTGVSEAAE
tara:strand:- start:255 stop:611 length:357 start_codon:yes stop_codon:yes gene_type:complete